MTTADARICEVCGEPIEPGQGVVLGQESDGVTVTGLIDPGADGRLALFHEEHWAERIGPWVERDRGHATGD